MFDTIPHSEVPEGFYSEPLNNRKAAQLEQERRDEYMSTVAMTDAEITEALAGSRQRGVYRAALEAFVESGEKGARVDTENGEFQGKSLAALYQSFAGNAKEHASNVRVVKNESGVYLINTDLV